MKPWSPQDFIRAGYEPEIETDQAKVQEIKNSIAEGELILSGGKTILGRKMSEGELNMVRRSIDNSKRKIGLASEAEDFELESRKQEFGKDVEKEQ